MGCCLRRPPRQQPPALLTHNQQCPRCQRQFLAQTHFQDFVNHTQACRHQQHPQPQQPIPIQDIVIEVEQPVRPQHPLNPGQFLMDDFRNNKAKMYWAKELLPGSKTRYKWLSKPVQPLPFKTVPDMLSMNIQDVKTSEFPTKQTWFRLQLEKIRISWQQGADSLHINKGSYLMTTLNMYRNINWHKEVKVHLEGDQVLDAGGLLREWSILIMKEMVHPESGMFQKCDTDDVAYKFNAEADVDEHILDCFSLLGTVVGKCIFERIPLNVYFDRSLIKHILGQPVTLDDIYWYDKQLFQSWDFLTNNKFDAQDLCEYFAIYTRGKREFQELKPNGQNLLVDMDNAAEYVSLCINYYTYTSIKPFLNAFLKQLYEIVPKQFLSIFEPLELEMVLYGIPFIDVQDWKENTQFKGAYYRNHQVIMWFWEVAESYEQPDLAKLLQFCTGSQRTPVEGFRKLESNRGNCSKFCIESIPFKRESPYPKAHTCTNRLELPLYESKEEVKLYIDAIVHADMDGIFGLDQDSSQDLRRSKQSNDSNNRKPGQRFTLEEDRLILELVHSVGPKFQKIHKSFPGKTLAMVKNRYYKHLRYRWDMLEVKKMSESYETLCEQQKELSVKLSQQKESLLETMSAKVPGGENQKLFIEYLLNQLL